MPPEVPLLPLDPLDAVWLHMDRPDNLMMITAVLRFAGPVSRQGLLALVQERLVAPYPRFSRRVVDHGRPHWEHVGPVDLSAHVQFEVLDPPGDEAALARRTGELMSLALDPSRPLWHLHVLEGLARPHGGQGVAVVARVHHCIGDGMALGRVLLGLADEAQALEPAPPHGLSDLLGRARRVLHHLRPDVLRQDGAQLLHVAADASWELAHLVAMRPDPRTALRGPLSVEKRAAWSRAVPLDRVKALGRAHGATVNDVLLSAVAGALGGWLRAQGTPADVLRACVPVDLRGAAHPVDPELGNHFSLVFLRLPVGEADPIARLLAVKQAMDALKGGTEPLVTLALLQATGRAPRPVEDRVVTVFGDKASAVMTNVPGPREPLHMAGVRVDGITFWVPQAARLGLGISIFSYAGEVSIGVAADALRMPDPEHLAEGFGEALDALEGALVGGEEERAR